MPAGEPAGAVGRRPRFGPAARRPPNRPSARALGWEGRTLTKVDQAAGVAGTFVLTGQVVGMESASGSALVTASHMGAVQGGANIINGVQDAAIGTGNLIVKGVNTVAGYRVMDEGASPDWSRNLVVPEDETAHNVSKFVGGQRGDHLGDGRHGRRGGVWCGGVAGV